jgi:hypothetical protein
MRTQLAEFESRYAFLSRCLPSMHMFSVSIGIETVLITLSPVATLTTNTISIQFIMFTPGVPALNGCFVTAAILPQIGAKVHRS